MTNSVRTCLLNQRPWTGSGRPPGEQYVPASYTPRVLPADLDAARTALIGAGADRAGINITLARILAYLHASRFFRDVVAADPRITYDPMSPAPIWDAIGPFAAGPGTVTWSGISSFDAPGRAYGKWTVTANGSGSATVTLDDGSPPVTGPVETIPTGDRVWLPESNLGIVLPTATAGTWPATLLAPPAYSFLSAADLSGAASMFRPSAGGSETIWYQTWSGNGPIPDRAGALALALAARILELGS